ncbi:MAG TPA: helix-turn-helix domain-containing protein [Pseudomonadota bacterium]|nr:helix-turn-helix domain-containing protein [Pseudomonadota bacterium]
MVSQKKVTRAAQKEGTRERIRRAAWELFSSQGFEQTTTKAIAERAEVAGGTVFVHARDKDDLLFLVMHDKLSAAVEDGFATLPAAPFLDQLLHIFGKFFRMYAEAPRVAHAFVRTLPGASGPNAVRVNALTFAFLHRLATHIRGAQETGELDAELNPLQAAQNFFALYYMALMSWLAGFVSLEGALDPGLRSAAALQLRGMLPR